jgi:sugar lactone lactonase YvrE
VAVAIVAVAAIGAVVALPRAGAVAAGAGTVAAYSTSSGELTSAARVGRGPASVAVGAGAVWVANLEAGTLSRVDPGTGDEEASGGVGTRPSEVVIVGATLVVADPFADSVTFVDAATGAVIGSISLHAASMAATADAVWVADDVGGRVARVDPRTQDVVASVPVEGGVSAIAASSTGVWAGATLTGELHLVDPATEEVTGGPIPVAEVDALAWDGTAIWAASSLDDRVVRVDPGAGRVTRTVETCDTPTALAGDPEGGVWTACTIGRRLWHLDATGTLVSEIVLPAQPTGIALDGDRIWVTLRGD